MSVLLAGVSHARGRSLRDAAYCGNPESEQARKAAIAGAEFGSLDSRNAR
jgi:hypothetical protein